LAILVFTAIRITAILTSTAFIIEITICAAFVVTPSAVDTQIAFWVYPIVDLLTIGAQLTFLSRNADLCRHDERSQNKATEPQGNSFAWFKHCSD
jgi:hypothetical protein